MISPLLELVGVEKKFGYKTILNGLDLKIFDNEFVLLIGQNGAGKSTLLRIISLLTKQSKGIIFHYGKKIEDQRNKWLKFIGILSHQTRFYSDLSAFENLKLFGKLYRVPNLNKKIINILKDTNLSNVANFPLRTFSNGMNKRLKIGQLIMLNPKFLILDEPFTGLDNESITWFINYLLQFNKRGGTVLIVTHQLDLGLKLASRVLVLKKRNIFSDMSVKNLNTSKCKELLK